MAGDVEFSLTGLDGVLLNLRTVTENVRKTRGRSSLRKAGLIIVEAAKRNVQQNDDPETERTIASNIVIQWNNRRFRATGDIAFRIGVRGGARIPKGEAVPDGKNAATPHWRFLEFGTKVSPAKPFLRPAMADNINTVTNAFVTELEKSIARAIRTGKR